MGPSAQILAASDRPFLAYFVEKLGEPPSFDRV
jgi:hypothetical protein